MSDWKNRFSTSGLGRTLFGGVLAFMALDNFRDLEGSIGYADSKGVPEAETLVPFSSGMLLFGGLGITLGRFKQLAPGAVVTWFVAVTPQMHDFWNMEDDQREGQQVHFLKNLIILGGALFFLANENED
ncbi:DoxX family protein (plasmid) [Halococcus dombrowskii]|uniref:DoxX family protein n=1 Tax=Halococcus dombrowskii TaxID=179637 RepID=A0AAV3SM93_HALDO|nr:DoxX family protein [Halococcus dombrowskii]UOO96787.1 DoxX family protein [Halococcus dombrowskii]